MRTGFNSDSGLFHSQDPGPPVMASAPPWMADTNRPRASGVIRASIRPTPSESVHMTRDRLFRISSYRARASVSPVPASGPVQDPQFRDRQALSSSVRNPDLGTKAPTVPAVKRRRWVMKNRAVREGGPNAIAPKAAGSGFRPPLATPG
jgi:hypothetical protein